MTCHTCGGTLAPEITDLPFKTGVHSIIIIRDLPVLQCGNCGAFMIEDAVMEEVDRIISHTEEKVEIEILRYAA